MSGRRDNDGKQQLRDVATAMSELGFPQLGVVPTAVSTTDDTGVPDGERAAALVDAYRAMVHAGHAVMEQHVANAASLRERLPGQDPRRAIALRMESALRLQVDGLEMLGRFLRGGGRGLLEQARILMDRGAAEAQLAARDMAIAEGRSTA